MEQLCLYEDGVYVGLCHGSSWQASFGNYQRVLAIVSIYLPVEEGRQIENVAESG